MRPSKKNPLDVLVAVDVGFSQRLPELLLDYLAPVLEERAELAFDRGGFPQPWQPSQRVAKTGGKTLIVTGRLRNSFRRSNSENIMHVVGGTQLRYGSRVPYAPFHMSTRPRSVIPLRRAIVFDGTLAKRLDIATEEWAATVIREAKQ